MGYLDGLTSAAFKKSDSGEDVFYPWGVLGSGVILDSEETLASLRKLIKKFYLATFIGIVVVQIAVGFWLNLILLPVLILWFHFAVRKRIRGLPRTTEKLRMSEAYRNSARSHNLATLILLELLGLGFVAIGIWMLAAEGMQLMSLLITVFFGFCCVAIGFMIYAKLQQRRAGDAQ